VPESPPTEDAADRDPLTLLRADRAAARAAGDPNALLCWLATTDAAGAPSVRTLVLREVDDQFALFLSATSPKAMDLARHGHCQLATWFAPLQRQWRLSARTRTMARDRLAESWQQRPRTSKLLDHLHHRGRPQSGIAPDQASLESALADLDDELGAQPSMPDSAQGVLLEIHTVECLQLTGADALHRRRRWQRGTDDDAPWSLSVLVP
jgi:pyridoxamine 5'-phosphate oxidase